MMQGSKIVLPSSDVEEYSANILQTTISRIVNPKSMILIYNPNVDFLSFLCRSDNKILLHK